MNKENKNINTLLPIAIMAHNEEKVIGKSIRSVLSQSVPVGYTLKVVVVSNACTDKTDEVVNQMEKEYPDKIQLISMREKGKTRAINEAIKQIDLMSDSGVSIPYVIFLDADCEFMGNEILVNFVKGLDDNQLLCAISAHCVPDILFNSRKDIVSEVYRAVDSLARSVKVNSISGMCYAIRFEILKRIEFPEFQFAEDMFVTSRLNGRFFKNTDIKIVFKTPVDMRSEIARRTRQEISSRRYREYYSYLKNNSAGVELFQKPLGEKYCWGRVNKDNFFKIWLKLKGVKCKFYILVYLYVKLLARINASIKIKKIKEDGELDYWEVMR